MGAEMLIECGSCGRSHRTLEAVRACAQEQAWNAAMCGDAAAVEEHQQREVVADVALVVQQILKNYTK